MKVYPGPERKWQKKNAMYIWEENIKKKLWPNTR
jgi:hypothetical protein